MPNFPQHAKQALRVYLERGETAIAKADAGDLVAFEEVLRLRKAAFHNFRVFDAMAQESGTDISRDADVQQVWVSIQTVDQQLGKRLIELRDKTGIQIRQLSEARQTLGRYRSGRPDPSRFTHSA